MTTVIPDSKFLTPDSSRGGISILGSTGSIGRQTLEVAALLGIPVVALSADKNIELLEEQVRRFRPAVAAVADERAARDFKARLRDMDVRVCPGAEGLVEAACADGAETVVTGVAGTAGLLPTLAAIGLGRRIALANKETLVCAGELVMRQAYKCGAEIIPVDSEHSALFQCLAPYLKDLAQNKKAGRGNPSETRDAFPPADTGLSVLRPEGRDRVKRLILTASGGPFRGKSREELAGVTQEMAMRHPVWSMGKKVTIDSATMMNKGLEVIEAVHLFGFPPEKIEVVVHPESIIHSMVEFIDCSIAAQMAQPDMRLPIQYALTYPERKPSVVRPLDFTELKALTFEAPDMQVFPCLRLAIDAAGIRGTACTVLNGANEAAVELFLSGKLGFYGISGSIGAALDNIGNIEDPSLDDIIEIDRAAKRFVKGQKSCT